ncbi:beta-ketoacyl synthase N-terminal-like domain-containing protein [Paenibacillus taiwanensis]|uniref:beta-ketoacyl synthase N-terminal-like domain-containing protein n=1 Tax=Paenibacillus taiwanensis TaxID=401638 RepID=UPI0003F7AADF|nr:beta-ketoacyl synthase N-terminal-like domain-containing protein [Paenibacillus taiwanensis]
MIQAQRISILNGEQLAAFNTHYRITGLHQQTGVLELASLRGFIRSPFSPLIYTSATEVSTQAGLTEPTISDTQKGIILGSMFIDAMTEEEQWKDLLAGKKISPIMFPQIVPSSIVGFVNKQLSIQGPMTCISPSPETDGAGIMLRQAADWIEDGLADIVLVVLCDVPSRRAKQWALDTTTGVHVSGELAGGVVSWVMESEEHAARRGAASVCTVQELYDQLQPPGGVGMARQFWT